MKILYAVLTIVFTVLAMIRLIEMSFQFNGEDVFWTALFTIGAILFASSTTADE